MNSGVRVGNSERIDYIDVARGIALLMVIVGHMANRWTGLGLWIYSFHMPVFFIISGMLFVYNQKWREESIKTFVKRKAQVFLYPYFVFSALNLILIFIMDGVSAFVNNLITTVCLDGIIALWFLPTLFFVESIFILLMKKIRSKLLLVCIVIVFLVLSTLFTFINYTDFDYGLVRYVLTMVNIINRTLIGLIFVFIGYIYATLRVKINLNKILLFVLAIGSLMINLFSYLRFYNYVDLHFSIIGNPILYYCNAISGSLFLLIVSELLLSKSKLLSFYGRNTITIFPTHFNFRITTLFLWLSSLFISNYIISFIVAFVFVILVETLVTIVINKYAKWLISYKALKGLFSKNADK